MVRKEKTLEQRVVNFIRKHNLFSAGDKLVVAVSGGADSVCMIHILAQRQRELGVDLHVAHLNHQLRGGESDADASYVSDLARKLGISATIICRDVAACRDRKGGSLEEIAREVRYSFLSEMAKELGASKVVVGHTRDDNVETILMHLLRGSGLTGLCGLQPSSILQFGEHDARIEVVRPLLEVTRQKTLHYCRRHRVKPRSDSSNLSHSFLRNRIRLELLPALKNYNPGIDNALLRLAAIAVDDVSFIEEQTSSVWKQLAKKEDDLIYIDGSKMAALPRAIQRRVFRIAVRQLRGSLQDIEADHIEAMLDFLSKPAGRKLHLPQGLTLSTGYGRLVLTSSQTPSCPFPPLAGVFNIKIPGETVLPGWHIEADIVAELSSNGNSFVASFDLDRAGDKLIVRRRKPGDRFQPLGMSETKKLQDFMVDSKIPQPWRDRVPLVCSNEGILWVVGWRVDDRVKVTRTTKNILQLKFERQA